MYFAHFDLQSPGLLYGIEYLNSVALLFSFEKDRFLLNQCRFVSLIACIMNIMHDMAQNSQDAQQFVRYLYCPVISEAQAKAEMIVTSVLIISTMWWAADQLKPPPLFTPLSLPPPFKTVIRCPIVLWQGVRGHPAHCNCIGGYNYINYIFHQRCLSSRTVNEETFNSVFCFCISCLSPPCPPLSNPFLFPASFFFCGCFIRSEGRGGARGGIMLKVYALQLFPSLLEMFIWTVSSWFEYL